MRFTFLIGNIYGMGGTIRSTVNLTSGLVERHDVEIVSLAQNRATPFFTVDPRVRLRSLTTDQNWPDRPEPTPETAELELRPATRVPRSESRRAGVFNEATEREVRRFLATVDTDVVVATRPGLNSLLAEFGRDDYVRIGQEHLNLSQQPEDVLGHVRDVHTRLDGLTVLTDADRRDYAGFLDRPDNDPWLTTMANAIPDELYARSRLTNPVIATAGRLLPVKQYHRLVEAFATVADKHPDWQLRIYGSGNQRERVLAAIEETGLHQRVLLMGRTSHTAVEFAKASIVVCSSRQEGLSMMICESFAAGVPVVSFDCPYGPRELIDHERTGLLVTDQDVDALGEGMLRLVEDRQERVRMGAAAVEKAAEFQVETIAARWEALAERLLRDKGLTPRPPRRASGSGTPVRRMLRRLLPRR